MYIDFRLGVYRRSIFIKNENLNKVSALPRFYNYKNRVDSRLYIGFNAFTSWWCIALELLHGSWICPTLSRYGVIA